MQRFFYLFLQLYSFSSSKQWLSPWPHSARRWTFWEPPRQSWCRPGKCLLWWIIWHTYVSNRVVFFTVSLNVQQQRERPTFNQQETSLFIKNVMEQVMGWKSFSFSCWLWEGTVEMQFNIGDEYQQLMSAWPASNWGYQVELCFLPFHGRPWTCSTEPGNYKSCLWFL